MATLGAWLRQTREERNERLEEASEATRVRSRFLEMLEAGEFAALPGGEVQVRGFLRIYARHLNLPADEVLTRYESECRSRAPKARSHVAPRTPPPSRAGRAAPNPLLIGVIGLVFVVVVVVGVAYAISQGGDGETASPTAAAPQAPGDSPLASTPSILATPSFPINPDGGVTLLIEATEHVWACVTVDGVTIFEQLLAPGQTVTYTGSEMVIVDTGNGAGLMISVNGQSQGVMGGRGEISTRAWSPTGEVTAPSLADAAGP